MANPSTLCLLSDLDRVESGTKIRFLGCVEQYDISSGTLHLRHRVEGQTTRYVVALVNIEPILESIKHGLVDVGTWLNVIGYRRNVQRRRRSRNMKQGDSRRSDGDSVWVSVDAALVWVAGAINVPEYEKSVALVIESRDERA